MECNFEFHLLSEAGLLPVSSTSYPPLRLDVWTLHDSETTTQDKRNFDKLRRQLIQDQNDNDVAEITVVTADNLLENATPDVLAASREIRALSKTLGSSVQTLFCMFLNYTKRVKVPVVIDNFIFYLKNWASQDLEAESSNLPVKENSLSTTTKSENGREKLKAIVICAKKKTLFNKNQRNVCRVRNRELQEDNNKELSLSSKSDEFIKVHSTPKARKSTPMCFLSSKQLWKLAVTNNMAKRKGAVAQKSVEIKKKVRNDKVWKCQPVVKKVTCVERNGIVSYHIEKSTRRGSEERLSLQELLKMKIEAMLNYETELYSEKI